MKPMMSYNLDIIDEHDIINDIIHDIIVIIHDIDDIDYEIIEL